jgi:hypothetical protein
MKKIWTVIGLNEADGAVIQWRIKAHDASFAMESAAGQVGRNGFTRDMDPASVVIIGAMVIPRANKLQTPGCDNNKSAYACNISDADDDGADANAEHCTKCNEPLEASRIGRCDDCMEDTDATD